MVGGCFLCGSYLGRVYVYGCYYCTEFGLFDGNLICSKDLGMVCIRWLLHACSFGICSVQTRRCTDEHIYIYNLRGRNPTSYWDSCIIYCNK